MQTSLTLGRSRVKIPKILDHHIYCLVLFLCKCNIWAEVHNIETHLQSIAVYLTLKYPIFQTRSHRLYTNVANLWIFMGWRRPSNKKCKSKDRWKRWCKKEEASFKLNLSFYVSCTPHHGKHMRKCIWCTMWTVVSVNRRKKNKVSMIFLFCVISCFTPMLQAPFGNKVFLYNDLMLQDGTFAACSPVQLIYWMWRYFFL